MEEFVPGFRCIALLVEAPNEGEGNKEKVNSGNSRVVALKIVGHFSILFFKNEYISPSLFGKLI